MPRRGYKITETHRQNLRKSHLGKVGYWSGKKRKISKKHKDNLSNGNRKRYIKYPKLKQQIADKLRGEKSFLWKGGISYEPYSVDWTKALKRSIRERDEYICQVCGKEPSVFVHHIDYNKKNNNFNNLITLCNSCHSKTNINRDCWIEYFNILIKVVIII